MSLNCCEWHRTGGSVFHACANGDARGVLMGHVVPAPWATAAVAVPPAREETEQSVEEVERLRAHCRKLADESDEARRVAILAEWERDCLRADLEHEREEGTIQLVEAHNERDRLRAVLTRIADICTSDTDRGPVEDLVAILRLVGDATAADPRPAQAAHANVAAKEAG